MAKLRTNIGEKVDYRMRFNFLQADFKGMSMDQKRKELTNFYKSAAKAADQRLVELERLSKKKGYKEVKQWAYREAMRDIRAEWGENAKRFNRKLPDNMNSIYKDINRVLNFLDSPTSSKKGIDEVYNKRANTINKRYGTNVTWSNVGDIFSSILWKKTNQKHGSQTVLQAIGHIQANEKKIKRALSQQKPISLHLPDDVPGVVEEEVNKLLRYYKKDVASLIKKV